MSAWIALLLAGLLTWAAKAAPSTVGDRLRVPPVMERASSFVAPAVLGALAARGVVGQVAGSGGIPALLGAVVAVPVAVRFRSIGATVAAGAAAAVLGASVFG